MFELPLFLGNNVAILIAALDLAKSGREICIVTDARPIGAHFAGMQLGEYSFDIGMVLIEKCTHPDRSDDLSDYRSETKNDWTRFGHLASDWLESKIELVQITTPQTLINNKVYPDYLIANRLEAFKNFPLDLTISANIDNPFHPRNKLNGKAYDKLTYGHVTELFHGQKLHNHYIEPFVKKITSVSSNDFLARYHRAIWVPLFYPETIRAASLGLSHGLPEYFFWTTRGGSTAALISKLKKELLNFKNVHIINEKVLSLLNYNGKFTVVVNSGNTISKDCLVVGLTNERFHTLLNKSIYISTKTASVAIMFCLINAKYINRITTCLMVVDEKYATYRLTDQDALAGTDTQWHKVTIEASPELLEKKYPTQSAELALTSEVLDILEIQSITQIKILKFIYAKNVLNIPDESCIKSAQLSSEIINECLPTAILTGSLLGYGLSSLNDQLIQGLKIAKEFE